MKKVLLLIGLVAILQSCTQENISPKISGKGLQVSLSLGGISTRSVDDPIIDENGKGYILPFSEVKVLKVELYKSLDENPIFIYMANDEEIIKIKNTPDGELARLNIPNIPATTQYVKVVINQFAEVNPNINHLQVTSQDTPPAQTMSRKEIPYEGISTAIIIPDESTAEFIKVKATVELAPMLSRFEVIPGEIGIVDPSHEGYVFDWVDGTIGRMKIKGFIESDINNAEISARENFKKKYNTEVSASAIYSYRVRLVRTSFPLGVAINTTPTTFYLNYFKQFLNSTSIVKNTNNGISDWNIGSGLAEYFKDGLHSNMYDLRTYDNSKVNAFHLFPQSVATSATLQQVKDGMPHLIVGFYYTNNPNLLTDRPDRWLTIRAFRDVSNNEIIQSIKPGYRYTLDLDDVIVTPWSLNLEVRITDIDKTVESDPIIKDFDQTSNIPEPNDSSLIIGLRVSKWREKNMEVEL